MPIPGENLLTISDLLSKSMSLLEWGPKIEKDRTTIKCLVIKSQLLLEDEEMEIIRFGDVTRIADHTFEPYQSIKSAISALEDFEVPAFEVDKETGETIRDEYGYPEIDCIDSIDILSDAYDAIEKVVEQDSFPKVY